MAAIHHAIATTGILVPQRRQRYSFLIKYTGDSIESDSELIAQLNKKNGAKLYFFSKIAPKIEGHCQLDC
jgi:hypothetical protein